MPLVYLIIVPLLLLAASSIGQPRPPSESPFAEHLQQLKSRVPAGFTVVLQKPFVVVGDDSPNVVRSRATNTVQWAVRHLKKDFFAIDPSEIIDIWLFKDKESYTRYTKELFGDTPTTPFGYYSPRHQALIMNIGTGGGTLVHEIVHPYMRANFPECPAWFNEGMGSLFEHSEDRNGHIRGLTNWRLPGLQQAIREKRILSFDKLLSTTTDEFYGGGTGYSQHYAQARYLCYYLQEKGLLTAFYRDFNSSGQQDKTGVKSLRKVLRTDDLVHFRGSGKPSSWRCANRLESEGLHPCLIACQFA